MAYCSTHFFRIVRLFNQNGLYFCELFGVTNQMEHQCVETYS